MTDVLKGLARKERLSESQTGEIAETALRTKERGSNPGISYKQIRNLLGPILVIAATMAGTSAAMAEVQNLRNDGTYFPLTEAQKTPLDEWECQGLQNGFVTIPDQWTGEPSLGRFKIASGCPGGPNPESPPSEASEGIYAEQGDLSAVPVRNLDGSITQDAVNGDPGMEGIFERQAIPFRVFKRYKDWDRAIENIFPYVNNGNDSDALSCLLKRSEGACVFSIVYPTSTPQPSPTAPSPTPPAPSPTETVTVTPTVPPASPTASPTENPTEQARRTLLETAKTLYKFFNPPEGWTGDCMPAQDPGDAEKWAVVPEFDPGSTPVDDDAVVGEGVPKLPGEEGFEPIVVGFPISEDNYKEVRHNQVDGEWWKDGYVWLSLCKRNTRTGNVEIADTQDMKVWWDYFLRNAPETRNGNYDGKGDLNFVQYNAANFNDFPPAPNRVDVLRNNARSMIVVILLAGGMLLLMNKNTKQAILLP